MSEYATIEHYVNHVMGEITKRDVEQVSERLRALGWEEVVRCRDCKHYEYWEFRDGSTAHDCARGGNYLFDTEPNGYCKWGERREQC